MQVDYEQRIDFDRMRNHRESRIQRYMDKFDISCLVLFETGNKRYATSTAVASPEVDNMARYAICPAWRKAAHLRLRLRGSGGKDELPLDQGPHVPGALHHVRRTALGLAVATTTSSKTSTWC